MRDGEAGWKWAVIATIGISQHGKIETSLSLPWAPRRMREQPETLARVAVPALDAILGKTFPVLDDGFIRVLDYMGDDGAIVQAARISYGAGTKQVQQDRGLIRYLLRHMHTTPFEMCEIKLHVRIPMDAWRQWIRHRTANVNEYSTRYSVAIDAAQKTAPDEWRLQSAVNRQGSGAMLPPDAGTRLSADEAEFHERAQQLYQQRLEAGVAREQARKDIPLSTYTEAYWKIDLHNLLHFLFLRMDEKAQLEIRAYASLIGEQIVAKWVPLVWEAFRDYRNESLHLSRMEVEIVKALNSGDRDAAVRLAKEYGMLPADGSVAGPSRERNELDVKLRGLGLTPPW